MDEPPFLPQHIGMQAQGHKAAAVLEVLQEQLIGRQQALDRTMFKAIDAGEEITEGRLRQWLAHKYEANAFLTGLERALKAGAAAERALARDFIRMEDAQSH